MCVHGKVSAHVPLDMSGAYIILTVSNHVLQPLVVAVYL